jgi:hypothetical protein
MVVFTSMFPSAFTLHSAVDTRLFSPANTAITRFHQRIDAIGKQPKGDDTQQHLTEETPSLIALRRWGIQTGKRWASKRAKIPLHPCKREESQVPLR